MKIPAKYYDRVLLLQWSIVYIPLLIFSLFLIFYQGYKIESILIISLALRLLLYIPIKLAKNILLHFSISAHRSFFTDNQTFTYIAMEHYYRYYFKKYYKLDVKICFNFELIQHIVINQDTWRVPATHNQNEYYAYEESQDITQHVDLVRVKAHDIKELVIRLISLKSPGRVIIGALEDAKNG